MTDDMVWSLWWIEGGGGGGRLVDERSRPLWHVPSVRFRSLILRDNLLNSWTLSPKIDSRALTLPPTVPTIEKMLCDSSPSPVIVIKFTEALISLDTEQESEQH